jgi:hypothetical protein
MIRRSSRQFFKIPALVFIAGLVAITTMPVFASASFQKTGTMNIARIGHSATLLANGQVLVAGGWNGSSISQTYLDRAELYDPAKGKWTLTGSMTVPRAGHSAVLLENGQVLVAGGVNAAGSRLTSAELYNSATGAWTATGSMTTARGADLILLPSGEVLAAGGDNSVPSTAELYQPVTGTWAATGSMTAGGFGGSAVLLQNGLVLAVGAGAADLYTPSTGTWGSTTPPISGSSGYIALLPSGQVWFTGSVYDPRTAQWIDEGGAAPCRDCATTMLRTGNVLAAGGVVSVPGNPYPTEQTVKSAKLWDPAVGEALGCLCLSWTSTGSLTVSRAGESTTLLSNGKALISGGDTFDKSSRQFVTIASAEFYTP